MADQQVIPAAKAQVPARIEQIMIRGDLSDLTTEQRLEYYRATCESMGLNPLTKPFEYIELNNKLVLYATRNCTDQLRNVHDVSVSIVSREMVEGVFVVTAHASMPGGRHDESVGAVPLVKERGQWKTNQNGKRFFEGSGEYELMKPEDRANAMMKAETKAKRRVTLSICGLSMLDETEVESIGAKRPPETTQEVAERRIAEETTKRENNWPAEIAGMLRGIAEYGPQEVMRYIQDQMIKTGLPEAEPAYLAQANALRDRIKGKKSSVEDMQRTALILWGEVERFRAMAKDRDQTQQDSAFGVA